VEAPTVPFHQGTLQNHRFCPKQWPSSQQILSQGGARMALSRNTVLLLLLPCPAVVYLAASLEDVSASSQCLSSPEAVRQEYPGSWPSWTTHSANHKGVKCWFPAMRENNASHNEAPPRRTAEVRTHKNTVEQRRRIEPGVTSKSPEEETPLLASASGMNELGWSFRNRTTKVGPVRIFDEFATVESSFDDRFAAVREVSSVSQPSVIQRMMDPVGAIP
jgi:hypothetical protein